MEIVNFDIIKSDGKLPKEKLKQYQTINHQKISSYPPNLQEEIMSLIFRAKCDGMYVKKETVMEHFIKPIKSAGSERFIKKNKS